MSAQRPPAFTSTDASGLPRTTLLMVPGGRDAQDVGALAAQIAVETEALLESLESAVARLALAHRSCTQDPEDQVTDDDAFAWVQRSLEDVAATLRGLSLNRSEVAAAPAEPRVRAVNGPA